MDLVKFKDYSRSQHKPVGRPEVAPLCPFGWFRVFVYSSQKLKVDIVLQKLVARLRNNTEQVPKHVVHEVPQDERATYIFHFKGPSVARDKLRWPLPPDGLQVRVDGRAPQVKVDDIFKERMEEVLLQHYSKEDGCLQMSALHIKSLWREYLCDLAQKDCLAAAIEVMEKVMPEVRILLLDDNYLRDLEAFRGVEHRLPQLYMISLINNEICDMSALSVFKNLPWLRVLLLKDNPIGEQIMKQQKQLMRLKSMLPQLVILGGRSIKFMTEKQQSDLAEEPAKVTSQKENKRPTPITGSLLFQNMMKRFLSPYQEQPPKEPQK